jgi:hypothetical protein
VDPRENGGKEPDNRRISTRNSTSVALTGLSLTTQAGSEEIRQAQTGKTSQWLEDVCNRAGKP